MNGCLGALHGVGDPAGSAGEGDGPCAASEPGQDLVERGRMDSEAAARKHGDDEIAKGAERLHLGQLIEQFRRFTERCRHLGLEEIGIKAVHQGGGLLLEGVEVGREVAEFGCLDGRRSRTVSMRVSMGWMRVPGE